MKIREKGFTLIELLVVISIIGVLSTIAMTSLSGARKKARDAERRVELNALYNALEVYFTAHGYYPSEAWCDSSTGSCNNACPCSDGDWTYSGSYIANVLSAEGYFSRLPLDPINDSAYYYSYEPNCNQGVCTGLGCCNYVLTCRLESGGSFTIDSAHQP